MTESGLPDVSVIICVRNGARTLRRQLDALDAQRGGVPFEVIVVDNGSTDGTARLVREWMTADGHVHVAASLADAGSEPGVPRARNHGASLARGRVLAFCDADDVVDPDWVAAFAHAVDGKQLAGGRIISVTRSGAGLHAGFGEGLAKTSYLPHVGNCNCAVDRELFFQVGGYDESLPPYGFEDVDFSWRVQEAGHDLIYVPGARVRFTVSGNRTSLRKRFLLGKGRVLMAARFPRYDSTRYTVRSTTFDIASDTLSLLSLLPRNRTESRRAASRLVADLGRLAAVYEHRRAGVPKRRLLVARSADDLTPPRVAIATNNGDMGGGEVMLLNIAQALRSLGIEVIVVGPEEPGDLVIEAGRQGFRTAALRASGRFSYMMALARWRARHRNLPLWCNGLVPALATAGMGPRIVHLHRLPTGLQRWAAAVARIGARRILVPSEFVARCVPGATVLENWTADIPLQPRPPMEGPVRIGFLGRVTGEKGIDLLAGALAQMPEPERSDVRLVIAGESRFGNAQDDQQVAAALEAVADRTTRLGWVSPTDLFTRIDLLVCPSRVPETFGLAAAEAMAAGVPVIVSDAGALREVVGPSHAGVVPVEDSAALADAITEAIGRLRSGGDMGEREARARWEQIFSPASGARRVAAVLIGMVDRHREETS